MAATVVWTCCCAPHSRKRTHHARARACVAGVGVGCGGVSRVATRRCRRRCFVVPRCRSNNSLRPTARHSHRTHARPEKPTAHEHWPVSRLQWPTPPHSTVSTCGLLVPLLRVTHAKPAAHVPARRQRRDTVSQRAQDGRDRRRKKQVQTHKQAHHVRGGIHTSARRVQ
jgi:hypothetical protein